jgi:hypothetical protein
MVIDALYYIDDSYWAGKDRAKREKLSQSTIGVTEAAVLSPRSSARGGGDPFDAIAGWSSAGDRRR